MKLLEKIFSVKSCNMRKVVTILGLKFKFRDKNREYKNELEQLRKTIQNNQHYMKLQNNELIYANVFNQSIMNSPWLVNRAFTLIKGAANYSLIFNLYEVLENIKPSNILEFGLGQTSIMTSQYVGYFGKKLTIVEHNQEWINIFSKKHELNGNIRIVKKDLVDFELNNVTSDKYESLDDITEGEKFDLIIIDGPFGFDRKYPRTNILDLIPQNIDPDNFVIILDDAEREGEKNTAQLIFDALKQNNINFKKSYKNALKTQLMITSAQYEFVHWY